MQSKAAPYKPSQQLVSKLPKLKAVVVWAPEDEAALKDIGAVKVVAWSDLASLSEKVSEDQLEDRVVHASVHLVQPAEARCREIVGREDHGGRWPEQWCGPVGRSSFR